MHSMAFRLRRRSSSFTGSNASLLSILFPSELTVYGTLGLTSLTVYLSLITRLKRHDDILHQTQKNHLSQDE